METVPCAANKEHSAPPRRRLGAHQPSGVEPTVRANQVRARILSACGGPARTTVARQPTAVPSARSDGSDALLAQLRRSDWNPEQADDLLFELRLAGAVEARRLLAELVPEQVARLAEAAVLGSSRLQAVVWLLSLVGNDACRVVATRLLSRRLVDWIVTDEEATVAMAAVNSLGDLGAQVALIVHLDDQGLLGRALARNSDTAWMLRSLLQAFDIDPALAEPALERLFWATDDVEVMAPIFATRFGRSVAAIAATADEGGRPELDPDLLEEVWTALSSLPPAHVTENDRITGFGVADHPFPRAGGYEPASGMLTISSWLGMFPLSLTVDVEQTVRHEVGHAVDRLIDWRPLAVEARFGGWRTYQDLDSWLVSLLDLAGIGASSFPSLPIRSFAASLRPFADDPSGLANLSGDRFGRWAESSADTEFGAWYRSQSQDGAALAQRFQSAAVPALIGAFRQEPYTGARSSETLDGDGRARTFQRVDHREGNGPAYSSYLYEARSRRVSDYQFSGPGEWFAEAYAAYYEPSLFGETGDLLARRDPDTKAYFDSIFADRGAN